MKNKRIGILGILGAGVLSTALTGCEKLVQSPVVAEVEAAEGSVSKGEKQPAKARAAQTVPEQVQAPETYTADFKGTYQISDEFKPATVHVTSKAPVEVPEVEKILLKKVTRTAMPKETKEKWEKALSQGEPLVERPKTEGSTVPIWDVVIDGSPYELLYTQDVKGENDTGFYWHLDYHKTKIGKTELHFPESGKTVKRMSQEDLPVVKEHLETLLKEGGLTDFRVSFLDGLELRTSTKDVPEPFLAYTAQFYIERMVDGVPVTYTDGIAYPVEEVLPDDQQLTDFYWRQEVIRGTYEAANLLTQFVYDNYMEISPYSDEEQFLLPFEEIRRIFEDTITEKIAAGKSYREEKASVPLYPESPEGKTVEVAIDKVQLGYMRVQDGDSRTEGVLIPVWDFFGTWRIEGDKEGSGLLLENVSLLTIDARDGIVLERVCGY